MQSYSALFAIADAEVEPLSVALSVGVGSHVQVILEFSHPDILCKVPIKQDSSCPPRTNY